MMNPSLMFSCMFIVFFSPDIEGQKEHERVRASEERQRTDRRERERRESIREGVRKTETDQEHKSESNGVRERKSERETVARE